MTITGDLMEQEKIHAFQPTPDERPLGRASPLRILLCTCIGPLLEAIGDAGQQLFESVFVGNNGDSHALPALAVAGSLGFINVSASCMFHVTASSIFARLRGEGRECEIAQVFADLIRIVFVTSLLIPLFLLPCLGGILSLFSGDDSIVKAAKSYLIPVIAGVGFTCFNRLFIGTLQAEGRSFVAGVIQLANVGFTLLVFDPILIIVADMGIFGAGLSILCADFVIFVLFVCLFISARFDTQTSVSNLRAGLSKDTYAAVKTGIVEFFMHFVEAVPGLLNRWFLMKVSAEAGNQENAITAYDIALRFWEVLQGLAVAVGEAVLAATSFAAGANRYQRVLSLLMWGSIIAGIGCGVLEVIILTLASQIAQIFTDSNDITEMTARILATIYVVHVVSGQAAITAPWLQAVGEFWLSLSLVVSVEGLVPAVVGLGFYLSNTYGDVYRLIILHPVSESISVVICLVSLIVPILRLRRKVQEQEATREFEAGDISGKVDPGEMDESI
jgi:Na+-driven multidrug efflux pump